MSDSEGDSPPPPPLFKRQLTESQIIEKGPKTLTPRSYNLTLSRHQTTDDASTFKKGKEEPRKSKFILHPLSGHILTSLRRISSPACSPDGKHIAFSVKELTKKGAFAEEKNEKYVSRLYLLDASRKTLLRLTSPRESIFDSDPTWLDNKTVGFLSNRSGNSQIWGISIDGGEAQQLSNYPVSVECFKFNRKSKVFVFACDVYPDISDPKKVLSETKNRDDNMNKTGCKFSKYKNLYIRRWDTWSNGKERHIFIQQACIVSDEDENGAKTGCVWEMSNTYYPQDIMFGLPGSCPIPPFGDNKHFDISPSGDEIAYCMHSESGKSSMAWSTNESIYRQRIALKTGVGGDVIHSQQGVLDRFRFDKLIKVECSYGRETYPTYSPDGVYLAFLSMKRPGYEADKDVLVGLNLKTQQIEELSPAEWDVTISDLSWSLNSRSLFLCCPFKARMSIFKLDLDEKKALPKLIVNEHSSSSISSLNENRIIFLQSSFSTPSDLWISDSEGKNLERLTSLNEVRIDDVKLSTAQEVYFKGAKNDLVQGWFFPPSDYVEEDGKVEGDHPLAVIIHGGPQGAIFDSWHYRWNPQTFATQGYAVLCVNFHGSVGFGQKFTDAVCKDWGGAPYQDIMMGIDYILAEYPWVDGSKIGALGASYGGYMINWINGQTDRFKCLVNHDGCFNLTNMYFATEEMYFPEWEFGGVPWESDNFEKFSPHNFVKNWKTPTLVIHGGKDYRVPDTEGIATFSALQKLGVESEFLYFPDENHWVLKPANVIIWQLNVLDWLDRYLK